MQGETDGILTAVNPMHKNHQDPKELDLTKPRLASYKKKWKVQQDTVYWGDIQLAQRKGSKFYQTGRNAVIVDDTAYCISAITKQKTGVSAPNAEDQRPCGISCSSTLWVS